MAANRLMQNTRKATVAKRFRQRRTVSRAIILPYKGGSRSAKALAQNLTDRLGLKVRRVRHDGTYRPRARSLIINYGSGSRPAWPVLGTWLNRPELCASAGNKLSAFRKFKEAGLSCPEWTTNQGDARQWIEGGATAVCRTILNGHSGRGIVLADTLERLVNAPLYVKYK